MHLNPVKTATIASTSLEERRGVLRAYPWSSYLSYIGRSPRNKFVDYKPMLGLMGGHKADKPERGVGGRSEHACKVHDEVIASDHRPASAVIDLGP